MNKNLLILSILFGVFLIGTQLYSQTIRYVDPDATGNNTGSSWTDAYTSIQAAINAVPGNVTSNLNYQIWVKSGVHTPGTTKTDHFLIDKSFISIYGGFNGTETQLTQRDIDSNLTVLSGDLLGDDTPSTTGITNQRVDNTYNVVTINASGVTLDGFTIKGGHADGSSNSTNRGAGLRILQSSDIKVRRCIFENNSAELAAAVLLDVNINVPIISFVDFSFNQCVFRNNSAFGGAGFFIRQLSSTPPRIEIVNSLFESNEALANGTYPGGSAIWVTNSYTTAQGSSLHTNVFLRNCTLVKNNDQRTDGSVIVAGSNTGGAITRVRMDNSIFHQNTNLNGTSLAFNKSTYVHEGTGVVAHSQDDDNFSQLPASSKTNPIASNPLFIDFANGDYSLQSNSPCKDTGLNGLNYGDFDLLNNPRVYNGTVDRGAYEKQACVVNIPDANFKAVLVNNNSINTNGNSEIECSEASAFSGTINVSGQGISDLTGIESFVNVSNLYVFNNTISFLDVTQNTLLKQLVAYNNNLTSLDVTQNTALERLDLLNNNLTSIDVSQNTALTNIILANNNLSNIDVTQNVDLNFLDVRNNNLTSIDVSQNVNQFAELNVNDNNLTSLDLSNNIALTFLHCRNNQLTSLDMRNGGNIFVPGSGFDARDNPNLACISVDNPTDATTRWTNIDSQTSFNANCATASIDDLDASKFSIFPNPVVSNSLIIKTQEFVKRIEVFDFNSKILLTSTSKSIDMSKISSGIYFVRIIGEENKSLVRKIIKK